MKWIGRISSGLLLVFFCWWAIGCLFFPSPRQALGFGFHTTHEYRYTNGFLPDYRYEFRADVTEEHFERFVRRLSLRPFEELTADERHHISWDSWGAWNKPLEGIEGTYGKTDLPGTWIAFAKYDDGTLYFYEFKW